MFIHQKYIILHRSDYGCGNW